MNWQLLFPDHSAIANSEYSNIIESFGESVGDYPALPKTTVLSTNHRGYIKLNGPDSERFLQGQVTCDLSSLEAGESKNGAHLTPKGRIIFLFSATKGDDGTLLLETHHSVVEVAISSLRKYSVFFKTEIVDVTHEFLSVMISGSGSESLVKNVQWHSVGEISPSVFSTTLNVASAIEQLQTITHLVTPAGQGYSDLLRIRAGTADVVEQTSDEFIVQMINLDALDYINFKKGCYTGQEIVARAHYRGAVKRRLYRIGLDTEVSPPLKQGLMNTEGKVIGTIAAAAPASNTTVEVLAILAIKSADCSKVKFGEQDLVPMRLLPLPYELPKSS